MSLTSIRRIVAWLTLMVMVATTLPALGQYATTSKSKSPSMSMQKNARTSGQTSMHRTTSTRGTMGAGKACPTTAKKHKKTAKKHYRKTSMARKGMKCYTVCRPAAKHKTAMRTHRTHRAAMMCRPMPKKTAAKKAPTKSMAARKCPAVTGSTGAGTK